MIQADVYLAGALTKVKHGYTITSNLNTTSDNIEIQEPAMQVMAVKLGTTVNLMGGDNTSLYAD